MTTTTIQPTVQLRIGTSVMALAASGEIIEAADTLPDGTPDWDNGGVCDERGAGGHAGWQALRNALCYAERNAALCGVEIVRLPS